MTLSLPAKESRKCDILRRLGHSEAGVRWVVPPEWPMDAPWLFRERSEMARKRPRAGIAATAAERRQGRGVWRAALRLVCDFGCMRPS